MNFKEVHKKILKALEDEDLRKGAFKSTKDEQEKRISAMQKRPYVKQWTSDVKKAKENTLKDINSAISNFRNSFEGDKKYFYFAKDAEELNKTVLKIIGQGKLVVKSKSMVGEESELRIFLEKNGITVFETDLGEFLIQLSGEKPAHMVAPAFNMTILKIKRLLEPVVNEKLEDPTSIVLSVRRFLREKFFSADVGIIGANALSADTGSIVFVTNEGNGALTSVLPKKLIVITSVEKIYSTLVEALKAVSVQTVYNGADYTTYIHVINGPYNTENYGPNEIHLILVDNGRIRDDYLKETMYCVKCGACQLSCPVFQVIDGAWGHIYTAAIGVAWTYITGPKEKARALSEFCLECGRCKEVCPMQIDIPEIIRKIKIEDKPAI